MALSSIRFVFVQCKKLHNWCQDKMVDWVEEFDDGGASCSALCDPACPVRDKAVCDEVSIHVRESQKSVGGLYWGNLASPGQAVFDPRSVGHRVGWSVI